MDSPAARRDRRSALSGELPGRRLQHEHSMVVHARRRRCDSQPGRRTAAGFFGCFAGGPSRMPHPRRTSDVVPGAGRLPEAALAVHGSRDGAAPAAAATPSSGATLFSSAPLLQASISIRAALQALFGSQWRHEERDPHGALLSFFHGDDRHVVLRAKELRVLRPHGHLLRTGRHLTPDETAPDFDRMDERRVSLDADPGTRQHQPLPVHRAQLSRPVSVARAARVRGDRRAVAAAAACPPPSRCRPRPAAGSIGTTTA